MSSFVTNNNTRYTKRARVNNYRHDRTNNVVGAVPFIPLNNSIDLSKNRHARHIVETTIGSHNSKGLVILGGAAGSDRNHPQNPDLREIPLGSSGESDLGDTLDQLAHPPHPITFQGPGYLEFQGEVSIPHIRGDTVISGDLRLSHKNLHVNGDATVKGDMTLEGSFSVDSLTVDSLTITSTTESTSTTTGALVVPGGVGIAKNLYVGGEMHYQGIKLPDGKHLLNTLSTGLHNGGVMSTASATTIDITAGNGLMVDSHTDPDNPTETDIAWTAFSGVAIANMGNGFTHIYITSAGAVLQSIIEPTATLRRDDIYLGKILHWDGATIAVTSNQPDVGIDLGGQSHDFWRGIGPVILSGNRISANGVNLSIDKSAGDFHQSGVGFTTLKESPNIINIPLNTVINMGIVDRNGLIALSDFIIPGNYDNAGTVTAIPGSANRATNQRVYLFNSGNVECQYGQTFYSNLAAAQAAIATEVHIVEDVARTNGVLIAIISLRSGATDLSLATDAQIFNASKFGEVSIGAAGAATTDLQSAYNNSLTPEIIVDATRGALTIQDNATPIAAALFEVKDNNPTTIFSVDVDGIDATNITATGTVTGGSITDGTTTLASGDLSSAGKINIYSQFDNVQVEDVVFNGGSLSGVSTISNTVGNIIIDNQNATGNIFMDLGTNDANTFFAVRNNSGGVMFAANGAGLGSFISLSDGTTTLTNGNITGAAAITATGAVTGGSITDGTATLTGGDLTSAGDIKVEGQVNTYLGANSFNTGITHIASGSTSGNVIIGDAMTTASIQIGTGPSRASGGQLTLGTPVGGTTTNLRGGAVDIDVFGIFTAGSGTSTEIDAGTTLDLIAGTTMDLTSVGDMTIESTGGTTFIGGVTADKPTRIHENGTTSALVLGRNMTSGDILIGAFAGRTGDTTIGHEDGPLDLHGSTVLLNGINQKYEENTFIPALQSASGVIFTHTTQWGRYVRSGPIVHYYINVAWTGKNSAVAGDNLRLNLPFEIAENGIAFYPVIQNLDWHSVASTVPISLRCAQINTLIQQFTKNNDDMLVSDADTAGALQLAGSFVIADAVDGV